MADRDHLLWNHSQARHEPVPGEQLFAMTRGAERLTSRMLYHGHYGVEAQFLLDGNLWIGHRFPTKELAMLWAEKERTEHRKTGWTDAAN